MCHDSLENHYMQNFYLMFDYDQNMDYWDNMIPFEREIYMTILAQRIEERQQQAAHDRQ
jgi:hypothetical protein